jgi:hypothetical protein
MLTMYASFVSSLSQERLYKELLNVYLIITVFLDESNTIYLYCRVKLHKKKEIFNIEREVIIQFGNLKAIYLNKDAADLKVKENKKFRAISYLLDI